MKYISKIFIILIIFSILLYGCNNNVINQKEENEVYSLKEFCHYSLFLKRGAVINKIFIPIASKNHIDEPYNNKGGRSKIISLKGTNIDDIEIIDDENSKVYFGKTKENLIINCFWLSIKPSLNFDINIKDRKIDTIVADVGGYLCNINVDINIYTISDEDDMINVIGGNFTTFDTRDFKFYVPLNLNCLGWDYNYGGSIIIDRIYMEDNIFDIKSLRLENGDYEFQIDVNISDPENVNIEIHKEQALNLHFDFEIKEEYKNIPFLGSHFSIDYRKYDDLTTTRKATFGLLISYDLAKMYPLFEASNKVNIIEKKIEE